MFCRLYLHCLLSVSIDQLDKTDAPAYPISLSIRCLVSLSDGLAGDMPSPSTMLLRSKNHLPVLLSLSVHQAHSTLQRSPRPSRPVLGHKRCMRCLTDWPTLLEALSFLLTTNLSDPIFSDDLGAPSDAHSRRKVPYFSSLATRSLLRESRTPTTRRRSLCSRHSRMQVIFLPRAVLLPRAPAQLLERRASVTERRLKDRWNSSNSRGTRLQHIHFSRTSIPRTFKLLYSDCLIRVSSWKTPHLAALLTHCAS